MGLQEAVVLRMSAFEVLQYRWEVESWLLYLGTGVGYMDRIYIAQVQRRLQTFATKRVLNGLVQLLAPLGL